MLVFRFQTKEIDQAQVNQSWFIFSRLGTNHVVADDQQPLEFSATFEHDDTVTSVFMQSVILPCKAVLLVMEPEQVKSIENCR